MRNKNGPIIKLIFSFNSRTFSTPLAIQTSNRILRAIFPFYFLELYLHSASLLAFLFSYSSKQIRFSILLITTLSNNPFSVLQTTDKDSHFISFPYFPTTQRDYQVDHSAKGLAKCQGPGLRGLLPPPVSGSKTLRCYQLFWG